MNEKGNEALRRSNRVLRQVLRQVLALAVVVTMLSATGRSVYAVNFDELKVGDIVEAETWIYTGDYSDLYYDGTCVVSNSYPGIRVPKTGVIESISQQVIKLVSPKPAEPVLTEEQLAAIRAEAWKKSNQNPDNYLPKTVLSDGSTMRSEVPAHYMGGQEDSISAVFSAMENCQSVLGVPGENRVHLYSYPSLCGELMKKLLADNAAALGEQLSTEVSIGKIFELKTEIRDLDYNLLGLVEECEEAVTLTIALDGDLKKLAATVDFAVLEYAQGEVTVLMDLDEEPGTITISTNHPTGIYAVIYAPAFN